MKVAFAASNWGLSPRVRGNRAVVSLVNQGDGSIPACAGKPFRRTKSGPWRKGVYPRVCGETACTDQDAEKLQGLSPRVRGNQIGQQDFLALRGSIPACAGKPLARVNNVAHCGVYPRVCGETAFFASMLEGSPGLSPRVRGNRDPPHLFADVDGSIPACAGKPKTTPRRACAGWVYPRVCGETRSERLGIATGRGLSPRVRGNRA